MALAQGSPGLRAQAGPSRRGGVEQRPSGLSYSSLPLRVAALPSLAPARRARTASVAPQAFITARVVTEVVRSGLILSSFASGPDASAAGA